MKHFMMNLETLFYGLYDMNTNKYGHFDIKLENTTINENLNMNYIDFGLSSSFKKIRNGMYGKIRNFSRGYYVYPLDSLLLNREIFDDIKKDTTGKYYELFKDIKNLYIKPKNKILQIMDNNSRYLNGNKVFYKFYTDKYVKDEIRKNIRENTYDEYFNKIIPTVNVFSFGVMLLPIFRYLEALVKLFKRDGITSATNIEYAISNLGLLTMSMLEPNTSLRISAKNALIMFRTNILKYLVDEKTEYQFAPFVTTKLSKPTILKYDYHDSGIPTAKSSKHESAGKFESAGKSRDQVVRLASGAESYVYQDGMVGVAGAEGALPTEDKNMFTISL